MDQPNQYNSPEQNQQNNSQISSKVSKKSFFKFFLIFLALIVGAFVLYAVVVNLIQAFSQWQGEKRVEKLAEELKRLEQESYQAAMADTYGGKTPQETLKMYIEAVEKGDYELASKYFIGENRQKELESSNKMNEDAVQSYIKLLKDTLKRFDNEGSYDLDKKYFSIYKPILIRMSLYPNGTWKIIEI